MNRCFMAYDRRRKMTPGNIQREIVCKRIGAFPFLLLVITVISGICSHAPAQYFSCPNAEKALAALTEVREKSRELDLMISDNFIGNINSSVINKYEDRLDDAQKKLAELASIDAGFKQCADLYPNEPVYLIYSAITKLTALGIVSQGSSYINFLRIDKRNEKRYDEIKSDWESQEKDLVKTARALMNRVLMVDRGNNYAEILLAICNFYENKPDKALKDLQAISTSIQEKIAASRNNPGEITDHEKVLSFCMTWLGYIYDEKLMNQEADVTLEGVRNINEPDYGSIDWIDHYRNQLKDGQSKTNDLKIPDFEMPATVGFVDFRTLKYQKENPLKKSVTDEFNMIEQPSPIIADQQELINKSIKAWAKLSEIENTPWLAYMEQMKICQGKLKKANYDKVFLKMNAKNKGNGKNNLLRFRNRFDESYAVLNELLFLKQCWTTLINVNPEISLFRIYRIKVDLGICYLSQNAAGFTDFFDYYKLKKGKKIPPEYLAKIRSDFETNPVGEINEDMKFCKEKDPDNPANILTGAEIAVFTKSTQEALTYLNDVGRKIPVKTTIGGIEPNSIIELYKSYLFFKMGLVNELKQSVMVMNSYSNTQYWAKNLKNYIYCLENQKMLEK